jgi:predicted GNAT family acetyltransferase
MHPLDRPIWNALRTRQRTVAIGGDKALRMLANYGHFAAAADGSTESRAALSVLVPANDLTWILEVADGQPPPGTIVKSHGPAIQMVAANVDPPLPDFDFVELTEADVTGMRELAHLAQPGPFLACTHRLGDFIGVKQDNCLVAMAGERLKLDGFTEISAVCTLPDQRGQGLAGNLVRVLANRITTRGDTPFLHAYGGNKSAIALYKKLGFAVRRRMSLMVLAKMGK